MEMNQLEAMAKIGGFQHLAGRDQARCIQSKLRVLAAARRPFARPFAVKTNADSDHRLETNFFRSADRLFQLFQFFDHNDNALAELAAEQRDPNKGAVLVTVADDQALRVLVHGERCDQLRFASRFQTKMKFLAGIDDFFDDFAELVHLDREHAAVMLLVTEFLDRLLECAIYRLDAVAEQILEAKNERKAEAAIARFVNDFENVDSAAFFLERADLRITGSVDREVTSSPAVHVVSGNGGFDVPLALHSFFCARRPPQSA